MKHSFIVKTIVGTIVVLSIAVTAYAMSGKIETMANEDIAVMVAFGMMIAALGAAVASCKRAKRVAVTVRKDPIIK